MISAEKIKEYAKQSGADIVGITSMDRFEGLPKEMDPRQIFPEAKSMIVLGFRIFRGCFRGIEEGTWFASYSIMGYNGIRWIFQPVTMWSIAKMVEDEGYEAVPIVDNFPWSNIDNLDPDFIGQDFINVNRTMYGEFDKWHNKWSKPVSPERPAPDIFIPLKICAYNAGLGEIGYSGMFLTPEFGPRQRFAAIITDAPLTPDPIFEGKLCDRCMECVRECPASAIFDKETVKINVGGRTLEWAKIDFKKCSVSFFGGVKEFNPFMVTEEDERGFTEQPYTKSMTYKFPPHLWDGRGIEGMRGCQIACFIHLEEQGKLKNTFKRPFRTKRPWKMEVDK